MVVGGVVQEANSPWLFPIVLVIKKDRLWWFCVDYQNLNQITKHDAYPLLLINELLDWVGGSVYRSSMYLILGSVRRTRRRLPFLLG